MQIRYKVTLLLLLCAVSLQQSPAQFDTLTVTSNLVLVPALVKSHRGERIYTLTAQDFTLLDNGIPQILHLEEETGGDPLALAVIVQTGGHAAEHLKDYRNIEPLLDDMIGDVPHTVAVIRFDSAPSLAHTFSTSIPDAAETIAELDPGDRGAAILDAIAFGIRQLNALPLRYRRAILLISETSDNGSQISLDSVVRAVGDSNTTIYSLAFSSTRSDVAHHAKKLPGTTYAETPYAPGGCMSRTPGADPDAHGNRAIQGWDCAGDLLPPLRMAEIAFVAVKDKMRRNVPQALTHLTGGEYFSFKNANSLAIDMGEIRNDLPNRYLLSFRPTLDSPGPHVLRLQCTGHPNLSIRARTMYWVNSGK